MDIFNFNDDFKQRVNKIVKYVFPIGLVILVVYFYLSSASYEKKAVKLKFSGTVEEVVYDGKSFPLVTIKGEKYYLGSHFWNFEHQITVGDYMEKDSGRYLVKLIKRNGGKVIIFDNK